MYKILEKTQFSEKVFKFRIEAPRMAKHAHAGQFLARPVHACGLERRGGLGRVHLHGDRQDHGDAVHL